MLVIVQAPLAQLRASDFPSQNITHDLGAFPFANIRMRRHMVRPSPPRRNSTAKRATAYQARSCSLAHKPASKTGGRRRMTGC